MAEKKKEKKKKVEKVEIMEVVEEKKVELEAPQKYALEDFRAFRDSLRFVQSNDVSKVKALIKAYGEKGKRKEGGDEELGCELAAVIHEIKMASDSLDALFKKTFSI